MEDRRKGMKAPHPVDIHVGNRLQLIRNLREFGQKELSRMLANPVTSQQLQKYEKGLNRLSASKIWELSQVLKVPPAYFFEELESPNYEHAALPAYFIKLAKEISSLPKNVRQSMILVIKEVTSKYKNYYE
jgi:transcriptional regulator with XRE-family HTH domain